MIIRVNKREPISYADEDYQFYLEKFQKSCEIHAYVGESLINLGEFWQP